MNCANCAAPLTATAQGGSFVCTYCLSHQVLHDVRISEDGIIDLEHFGDHDCPACNQRLHAALMDESSVEHCPACRGVLLPGDLFAHIVENRRRAYQGDRQPAADERLRPRRAAAVRRGSFCLTRLRRLVGNRSTVR